MYELCCICFEDIEQNILIFQECGHYLCNLCFEIYKKKYSFCPLCRIPIKKYYQNGKVQSFIPVPHQSSQINTEILQTTGMYGVNLSSSFGMSRNTHYRHRNTKFYYTIMCILSLLVTLFMIYIIIICTNKFK